MTAEIRVGTSGYSFRDWVGTVYPEHLPSKDFLSYYAQTFDTVEINTTYYRVPEPSMFKNMLNKVPEDFVFVVKLPGEMTHQRDRFDEVTERFLACLQPLADAGQLGGVLAQFPFRFKADPNSLGHLERIGEVFVSRDIATSVEFRHRGWYRREVYERLQELGLGFVNVDLPRLPGLPLPSKVATSDVGYFRLHGRNDKLWWSQPDNRPGLRYDYVYSDDEIEDWAKRIEDVASRTRRCFVYGNNCHLGSSYIAGMQIKRCLGLRQTVPPASSDSELFAGPGVDPIQGVREKVIAAREAERPMIEDYLHQRARERAPDSQEEHA